MASNTVYYERGIGQIGPFFAGPEAAMTYCQARAKYCVLPKETARVMFERMGTFELGDETVCFVVDEGWQDDN